MFRSYSYSYSYRFGFDFTRAGTDAGALAPGLCPATAGTQQRMEAHAVLKSFPHDSPGSATLRSTWTSARGHPRAPIGRPGGLNLLLLTGRRA